MIIMKMRDIIKGRFGQVLLIGLFVTMFGGLGITRFAMKFFGDIEGIVSVNGQEVSVHTFNYALQESEQKINMIRRQYGAQADLFMQLYGMSNNPQETALQQVIYNALLDQVAQKMHINLAQEYLEVRLSNPQFIVSRIGHLLPSYIFDQKFGINGQALMEFLKTPEMRFAQKELSRELRNQFALLMIQSGFYLPEFLTQALFEDTKMEKKFAYQVFSLDNFVRDARTEKITDDELKAFYDAQNQASQKYWSPETRQGSEWTFTPEGYGIEVSEKEIQSYYDAQKRTRYVDVPAQFKVREIVFNKIKEQGINFLKEEAEKVREKAVQAPDTFADLAQQYSQASTAKLGGLVDFFKRGTKEKAYEKAVVRLKENGEISPVVQLEDGSSVILQRVDRKEATFKSLAQVKDAIVKTLTAQKFRIAFTKEAQQTLNKEDKQMLDEFIKDHKGVYKEIKPIEKSDDIITKRLFSLKKDGQSVAFIHDGIGSIIQLEKKHSKKIEKLNTIRDRVADDYYHQKAQKTLDQVVEEARVYAFKHKQLDANKEKISSTDFITAQDDAKIKERTSQGFPHGFIHMTIQGAVEVAQSKDKTTLVLLSELKKSDKEIEKDKKNDWYKNEFSRFHQLFSGSFIASLYRNGTIKVNDQMNQGKIEL